MKKIMFAAIAALAITSCSQNEEFDAPSQKTVMGFSTMVSKTTRAAITDETALQKSGFKVYAYSSTDEITNAFPATFKTLMNPASVTHTTESGWQVDKEYYWPLTDKVHFYAFATDASAEFVESTASVYPTLSYTVAAAAADQKDFVLAKLENQSKSESAIALAFVHALTQVNFSAQGDKDGFEYTVKDIKITGVAGTGIYSFGTGKWTAGSDVKASYTYPINADKKVIIGAISNNLDVTGNTLMLMPQTMNANTKILVSYSVTKDESLVYETTGDGIEIPLTGKIDWEAGKKIRYSLTLANGSVSMKFAPTVGSWGETEVKEDPNPVK